MAGTLRKPSYKYMHVILNQCIRGRMPQAMFAVFLHSILRVFICMMGISLAASSLNGKTVASPGTALFAILVMLAAFLAGEIISYGLYTILASLVRNKATSIKDIFSGFTGRRKGVIKAAMLFTAINLAAIVLLGIILALPTGSARILAETLGENAVMLAATLAFVILAALLTLPFTFSYLILISKADAGVKESFTVSWKLLIRQVPHFIGFVIYAGGRDLATAVIIQLLLFVLPRGEGAGTSFHLITTIASFIGVLAEYRALTRGYMAICIYFFGETGILRPHGRTEAVSSSTGVISAGPESPPDAPECPSNSPESPSDALECPSSSPESPHDAPEAALEETGTTGDTAP